MVRFIEALANAPGVTRRQLEAAAIFEAATYKEFKPVAVRVDIGRWNTLHEHINAATMVSREQKIDGVTGQAYKDALELHTDMSQIMLRSIGLSEYVSVTRDRETGRFNLTDNSGYRTKLQPIFGYDPETKTRPVVKMAVSIMKASKII